MAVHKAVEKKKEVSNGDEETGKQSSYHELKKLKEWVG